MDIQEMRKITEPRLRRLALADYIETLPHKAVEDICEARFDGLNVTVFNMGTVAVDCKTPCCIAGHAWAIWGDGSWATMREAKSVLGLGTNALFLGQFLDKVSDILEDITPAQAAAALRIIS